MFRLPIGETWDMDLRGWDRRYRSGSPKSPPSPLLVKTAAALPPGHALDLACGTGRNALWLASIGWRVIAIDGSSRAIEILRHRAREQALSVDARIADLEKHEYRIEPSSWDLIAMCFYLQRDLFAPAKLGVKPGGVVLAIVHITEPGEHPTGHRLRPGELKAYFEEWEILHSYEGRRADAGHQRSVAEIVARKP